MSDQNTQQERTEQATPKRRQDARKKGDVPRSRELTMTGVMLTGAGGLLALSATLGGRVANNFAAGFSIDREALFGTDQLASALGAQAGAALLALVPLLTVIVLAALGASVMLGGFSFSLKAIAPKAERLNIGKGIKRMFSAKSANELFKAVAKFGLVALVSVLWLSYITPDVLGLTDEPVAAAIVHAGWLALTSLLVASSALIVVAGIDVPFQLWDYAKKLRMTRQEVRDEQKETDGKPEVKQRIRQMQHDIATRRMMDAVPYADVIITNPTHFAVALRYDDTRMAAPEVVAKGQDRIAARIRELAVEHDVPLFSAPPLARSLYHGSRIGERIPVGLYTAVAQVLAYLYQLRHVRTHGGAAPDRPSPEVDETRYVPAAHRRRYSEGDDA
jgi:flagellar biosynthetic protein FlhB